MKRETVVIGFWLLLCLLGGPKNASAQTSGITGVGRDSTGAVLPGVTVEAASPAPDREDTDCGDRRDAGRYKLLGLVPGESW